LVQEIATITKHERLQVEFDGVTVREDYRGGVEFGQLAGIELGCPGQILRRSVSRPGIEPQIPLGDVAPVQDCSLPVRIRYTEPDAARCLLLHCPAPASSL
jgi:hypothetical protein